MSNSNQRLLLPALAVTLAVLAACSSSRSPSGAPAQPPAMPSAGPPLAPPSAEEPSTRDALATAAAKPSFPLEGEGWRELFDGHSLAGWRETPFAGHGEVECRSGLLLLNMGDPFTGVNWTNAFPTNNYEIALDAMRVTGSDFFCGLTVPVADSFCSLIVGGWGGSLLGISSLDGMDASENETTKFVQFQNNRWYRVRLRITPGRIEGWLDDKKLVDVNTSGKKISLRPGDIELSKPFGLAAWQTTSAFRALKVRPVDGPADPPKKEF